MVVMIRLTAVTVILPRIDKVGRRSDGVGLTRRRRPRVVHMRMLMREQAVRMHVRVHGRPIVGVACARLRSLGAGGKAAQGDDHPEQHGVGTHGWIVPSPSLLRPEPSPA